MAIEIRKFLNYKLEKVGERITEEKCSCPSSFTAQAPVTHLQWSHWDRAAALGLWLQLFSCPKTIRASIMEILLQQLLCPK